MVDAAFRKSMKTPVPGWCAIWAPGEPGEGRPKKRRRRKRQAAERHGASVEAMRAYVALGSNLDDPAAQVRAGAQALGKLPGTHLVRCSSLYRHRTGGCHRSTGFINAVCALDTSTPAGALMQALLDIERRARSPACHSGRAAHPGP